MTRTSTWTPRRSPRPRPIALGDETNVLEQARRLRSYVYDRLEYEMGNADSPIGVLARGSGSCGEHVGTIMALYRRAGLACRVAGRYKSPYHPWSGGPLYPDFNHVWVDLYLPGYGWVPVESNPDGDVVDVGPYPDRFFLGLPWRHVEVGKDISFEKVTYDAGHRRRRIGARRLSRNHIRFDILAEIAPARPRPLTPGPPLRLTRPRRPSGPALSRSALGGITPVPRTGRRAPRRACDRFTARRGDPDSPVDGRARLNPTPGRRRAAAWGSRRGGQRLLAQGDAAGDAGPVAQPGRDDELVDPIEDLRGVDVAVEQATGSPCGSWGNRCSCSMTPPPSTIRSGDSVQMRLAHARAR